jgi:hypothetical protein
MVINGVPLLYLLCVVNGRRVVPGEYDLVYSADVPSVYST